MRISRPVLSCALHVKNWMQGGARWLEAQNGRRPRSGVADLLIMTVPGRTLALPAHS